MCPPPHHRSDQGGRSHECPVSENIHSCVPSCRCCCQGGALCPRRRPVSPAPPHGRIHGDGCRGAEPRKGWQGRNDAHEGRAKAAQGCAIACCPQQRRPGIGGGAFRGTTGTQGAPGWVRQVCFIILVLSLLLSLSLPLVIIISICNHYYLHSGFDVRFMGVWMVGWFAQVCEVCSDWQRLMSEQNPTGLGIWGCGEVL